MPRVRAGLRGPAVIRGASSAHQAGRNSAERRQASVPDPKRKGVGFQEKAALGTFPWMAPFADSVPGRNRAHRFEAQPEEPFCPVEQEAVERGLQRRGPGGSLDRIKPAGFEPPTSQWSVERDWHLHFNDRVMQFPAIAAQDGLDGDVKTAVPAARHFGAVTAFPAFEEIGSPHPKLSGNLRGCRVVVREAGVEPTTFGSGGRRSIQLSYSRIAPPSYPPWREVTNHFWPAGAPAACNQKG